MVKSWSPSPIFFKKLERFNQFSTLRLFIILISLTVTLFSEKMLIFTGCISTWFHVQLDQKIFDGFLPSCSIMPQVNNTSTPKSFCRRRMRSSMSTSGWKSPKERKNCKMNAFWRYTLSFDDFLIKNCAKTQVATRQLQIHFGEVECVHQCQLLGKIRLKRKCGVKHCHLTSFWNAP